MKAESETIDEKIEQAPNWIAGSDALLITAGAGMGVDSGLPDFRGVEGFWNAYPAYRHLGLSFSEMANPRWFREDPALAWGFYGHRLLLYRETQPHPGFAILKRWSARMSGGAFVFTSNVDGHFQRAGFLETQVVEVHGSIHFAQCLARCQDDIFPADAFQPKIDPQSFRCAQPFPRCPTCGAMARPNILMFGDDGWHPRRSLDQEEKLGRWLSGLGAVRLALVELGAGTGVPTVREFSASIASRWEARLIRINLREPEAPREAIGLALGGREALERIDAQLSRGLGW